ncbi:4'-phosphopantetheinyl transferase family protein [Roseospira visakhapatnamensis]|uniref:4'-phosphopantetheinyl transferase n=1 Tax=Roseospira visakhapatnamensis TaxID=390880 RepID=A0A7W6WAP1_9PROT|nr:4'-phosphopantetheinyl transferase superfamily protein [Roseospira visakhapatnamensis]MBB4266717.1 4'-phosphopantetheinyl transferase [Roseospira visakhapatnamensis]
MSPDAWSDTPILDRPPRDLSGAGAGPGPEPESTPAPLTAALWTLRPEHGGGPALETLRAHLSPNEWFRVSSFRDPAHAWSSAATRALLRLMLARYHGGEPLDWHFRTEPGGRPHVDMTRPPFPLTEATRPRFSLSHTRGLAACLVSVGDWPPGAELGVDAEWTVRTVPALRLAERFFHPDEARALAALPRGPARQTLFMTLWTRKEAVLKALGLGIANHLGDIACLGDPARIAGPAAMIGAPEAWRLGSEDATPDHRLSWAAHTPLPAAPACPRAIVPPAHRSFIGWPS